MGSGQQQHFREGLQSPPAVPVSSKLPVLLKGSSLLPAGPVPPPDPATSPGLQLQSCWKQERLLKKQEFASVFLRETSPRGEKCSLAPEVGNCPRDTKPDRACPAAQELCLQELWPWGQQSDRDGLGLWGSLIAFGVSQLHVNVSGPVAFLARTGQQQNK